MATKAKNKKRFLNYLLFGIVVVCDILLIAEIISNTGMELRANQLNDGYAISIELDTDKQPIKTIQTPTQTSVQTARTNVNKPFEVEL